jgi:hypothetical protein
MCESAPQVRKNCARGGLDKRALAEGGGVEAELAACGPDAGRLYPPPIAAARRISLLLITVTTSSDFAETTQGIA